MEASLNTHTVQNFRIIVAASLPTRLLSSFPSILLSNFSMPMSRGRLLWLLYNRYAENVD
jgi:hypothetical protein